MNKEEMRGNSRNLDFKSPKRVYKAPKGLIKKK